MALPILGFLAGRAGTSAAAGAVAAAAPALAPFVAPVAAALTVGYVVKKGCELLREYDNFEVSVSHGDTNVNIRANR